MTSIAAILLQTLTVLAMDEFPEDINYPSPSADAPGYLETPQAARAAFGNPADWMQWVESAGYVGSGGGYAGLQRQDADRPFIFRGGGFNGEFAFTGDYTFVCTNGRISAGLGAADVRDAWLLQPASFRFRSIPADVEIYRDEKIEAKCRIFPVDFYGRVRVDPAFEAEFTQEMEEWRQRCAALDGLPLPYNFSPSARGCIRIVENETDRVAGRYVLENTIIGDDKGWFDKAQYQSRKMVFEIPDEIEPYFVDMTVSDVDYLSDLIDETGVRIVLILRNGLFLREIAL